MKNRVNSIPAISRHNGYLNETNSKIRNEAKKHDYCLMNFTMI